MSATPKPSTTITFTLAEVGVSHVGMEAITREGRPGRAVDRGFSLSELRTIADLYEEVDAQVISLEGPRDLDGSTTQEADVLVIRQYISSIRADRLLRESLALEWDDQYLDPRRKRVMTKRKRKNLVFADFEQAPQHHLGKGKVVALETTPILASVVADIEKTLEGPLQARGVESLIVEGNLYQWTSSAGRELKNVGIGFHGDTERRLVVGLRVGREAPIVFEWYHRSERTGHRHEILLQPGDLYVMSDKATGHDWKLRSVPTLRHAAGTPSMVS